MRLSEILDDKGRHVYTARPDETVMDAVRKLVAHNIGALAIVDERGKLIGILSERDVLRMLVREVTMLDSAPISERMTRHPLTAKPDDDADVCLNTMSDNHIRHLPVTEKGKLTGMVSIGDLVKSKLDDAMFVSRHLTALVMGQYPA